MLLAWYTRAIDRSVNICSQIYHVSVSLHTLFTLLKNFKKSLKYILGTVPVWMLRLICDKNDNRT